MAVYQGVKLEGMRQLRRTLREAGDDLGDLKVTNLEAASIVRDKATGWAPHRSGKLARSVRASGTKTAGIIRAGNRRKTAAGVPYAPPIHWGWKKRNIKANPFVSYSAQATEPQWLGIYTRYIEAVISKIKGV